jgi:hypothetical protein
VVRCLGSNDLLGELRGRKKLRDCGAISDLPCTCPGQQRECHARQHSESLEEAWSVTEYRVSMVSC